LRHVGERLQWMDRKYLRPHPFRGLERVQAERAGEVNYHLAGHDPAASRQVLAHRRYRIIGHTEDHDVTDEGGRWRLFPGNEPREGQVPRRAGPRPIPAGYGNDAVADSL